MRLLTRTSMVAVLVAVLVGSGLRPAPATATPSGCLPGGTCVAIGYTGDTSDIPYDLNNVYPPIDLGWHIAVSGGALASATLITHDDPSVHAQDWPVYVNGNVLDPSAVTLHGIDLTIDLASVLPVPAGGSLDVSFGANVYPTTATLSSTVVLTFDDPAGTGPATAVSPPAVRHVELPDLTLSTATGSLPVPHGRDAALAVSVINHNAQAGPLGAGLYLDFPPGFDLGPAAAGTGYDSPICQRTGAHQWRCDKPHSGGTFAAALEVAASPHLRPGSAGRLRLRAWLSSPDTNPADNVRYVSLTATGIADLHARLTTPAELPSGIPQQVSVRISNAGPDPASGIAVSVSVSDQRRPPQLVVLGPDGRRWQPNQTSQRIPIARLAAGGVASFSLTLIGAGVGATATILLSTTSDSYDAAGALARAEVQVVAAGQPAAQPPSGSLAQTGPSAVLPIVLGLSMLILGLLLMLAARRRATD